MNEFTKEDAANAREAVDEIFKALSKPKQREYLGHLNEVFLFIGAAERFMDTIHESHAPEAEVEAKK